MSIGNTAYSFTACSQEEVVVIEIGTVQITSALLAASTNFVQ